MDKRIKALADLAEEVAVQRDKYAKTLELIATHFLGCDIFDDESALFVLRRSCEALGWKIGRDEYGQVKLDRG
jgi:hypothetical protein